MEHRAAQALLLLIAALHSSGLSSSQFTRPSQAEVLGVWQGTPGTSRQLSTLAKWPSIQ